MKKSLLILTAIVALISSCGPRTHADKTRDLLTHYFDSLALDLELVSLQVVDTIYTEMPADDSTFLALQAESRHWMDEAMKLVQTREFYVACNKSEAARDAALKYEKEYKGELIGYAYEVIVRCADYGLKDKTEGVWYLVNPEGASFEIKEQNFQEVERNRRKAREREIEGLLRSVRF